MFWKVVVIAVVVVVVIPAVVSPGENVDGGWFISFGVTSDENRSLFWSMPLSDAELRLLCDAASVFSSPSPWLSSFDSAATALWSGTNKNRDVSTGPLARSFARSLAPLTHSLAPDCSLRSRPPLRSLVRSLAHFAHSLARGTVNNKMAILSVFFSIFDHSAMRLTTH